MNEKYSISVKNISHSFREDAHRTEVLRNVSFEVRRGEFFTLLGPSGCGKSTLLRILTGMIKSEEGNISLGDRGREDSAMIFQSFAIFPWRTVYENVEFGLEMKGVPAAKRRSLTEEHVKEIGLAGFENAYPKDLSGGMKQRVGIARALALSPRVLFMDEPFSSLDAFTAEKLRKEVLDLWLKDRMTIVMVTHLVDEAVEMSDKILVMTPRPGRVEAVVPVGLPRPRNKRSKDFFALVDRIMEIVKV